jgi:hypothetical protein
MGYYRRYYPKPFTEYKTDSRGRRYSVYRGEFDGWDWGIPLFCGVMLVPFTYGLSLPLGAALVYGLTRSSRRYLDENSPITARYQQAAAFHDHAEMKRLMDQLEAEVAEQTPVEPWIKDLTKNL